VGFPGRWHALQATATGQSARRPVNLKVMWACGYTGRSHQADDLTDAHMVTDLGGRYREVDGRT
jgi:hypothetical protein